MKQEYLHTIRTPYTSKDAFGCMWIFAMIVGVLTWLAISYINLYWYN